jgi:hypothetical protein
MIRVGGLFWPNAIDDAPSVWMQIGCSVVSRNATNNMNGREYNIKAMSCHDESHRVSIPINSISDCMVWSLGFAKRPFGSGNMGKFMFRQAKSG